MKLEEIQAANRKKWIEALLSDAYKQGRFALSFMDPKKGQVFCVLGVGCAIMGGKFIPSTINVAGTLEYVDEEGAIVTAVITPFIQKKYGLKTSTGGMDHPKYKSLSAANDKKVSFKELAKIIEDGEKYSLF